MKITLMAFIFMFSTHVMAQSCLNQDAGEVIGKYWNRLVSLFDKTPLGEKLIKDKKLELFVKNGQSSLLIELARPLEKMPMSFRDDFVDFLHDFSLQCFLNKGDGLSCDGDGLLLHALRNPKNKFSHFIQEHIDTSFGQLLHSSFPENIALRFFRSQLKDKKVQILPGELAKKHALNLKAKLDEFLSELKSQLKKICVNCDADELDQFIADFLHKALEGKDLTYDEVMMLDLTYRDLMALLLPGGPQSYFHGYIEKPMPGAIYKALNRFRQAHAGRDLAQITTAQKEGKMILMTSVSPVSVEEMNDLIEHGVYPIKTLGRPESPSAQLPDFRNITKDDVAFSKQINGNPNTIFPSFRKWEKSLPHAKAKAMASALLYHLYHDLLISFSKEDFSIALQQIAQGNEKYLVETKAFFARENLEYDAKTIQQMAKSFLNALQ